MYGSSASGDCRYQDDIVFSSFFASSTDITLELLDEKCMVFELF
jgi:hypothetical protein